MAYKDFKFLLGIKQPKAEKEANMAKHRRDKAAMKQHLKTVKPVKQPKDTKK